MVPVPVRAGLKFFVRRWPSGSYSDDRFSSYKRAPANTAVAPIQRMMAIPGICVAKAGMFISGLLSPACLIGCIWGRIDTDGYG